MNNNQFHVLNKVKLHFLVEKLWFISVMIVGIFFLFLFLPWQQTVKGEGTLIALDPTQRDYSILSPIDGFVGEFHVGENQFVKKGEKLFTMVDLDKEYLPRLQNIHKESELQYENTKSQIQNLVEKKENLEEVYKVGLKIYEQKTKQITQKLQTLHFQKTSFNKAYEIESSNLQRVTQLFNEGIESKRSFEQAQNVYENAKAKMQKNKIDIEIEQNNLQILKNEKLRFDKDMQNKLNLLANNTLESKNKLSSLAQSLEKDSLNITRYSSGEVVAQKDGYVVRITQNDQNRFVKKGEEILYFSPEAKTRSIRLKVSDFNMPLIKEGLAVRIRFYGWPTLQVSGWPKIQYGTFGGIISKVESSSHEKGFFYAQVVEDPKEPWPKGDDLRIGTQSTVWVRLSTVPIWYQLWRLMNAVPPRMVTPVIEKD